MFRLARIDSVLSSRSGPHNNNYLLVQSPGTSGEVAREALMWKSSQVVRWQKVWDLEFTVSRWRSFLNKKANLGLAKTRQSHSRGETVVA